MRVLAQGALAVVMDLLLVVLLLLIWSRIEDGVETKNGFGIQESVNVPL